MDLPKSHFSDSRLNYRAPCTSREGRLCNIFKELPLWNEIFWPVGLQVRELYPGQLSLVEVYDGYYRVDEKEGTLAATFLIHLLTHHRCVDSLDLSGRIFFSHAMQGKQKLICDALRESPSLRKLKLRLQAFSTTLLSLSLVEMLPHLIQLRDLELCDVPYDRTCLEALSEFLASTRSLTTLTMTKGQVDGKYVVPILEGLKRNATITTLTVNIDILAAQSHQHGVTISEYLRRNKTLRTLSITARVGTMTSIDLRPIIGPLFHNDTLTELNLTRLVLSELIIDMLILNKTLRRFHIIECFFFFRRKYYPNMDPRLVALSNESFIMYRWLVALAENKTLQELTLALDWVDQDYYVSLFKALARHESLKKVTFRNFRYNHVTEICRAVRQTGVQDRVVVGKYHVVKDTVMDLPECKELSRIGVGCHHVDWLEPLRTALCLLPTCSHVKSLSFEIIHELFDSELSSLMAQYITNATALREMDVSLVSAEVNAVDGAEQTLLRALSLNKSIRRLSIRGLRFDDAKAEVMADMLDSSPTLCELSIHPYHEASTISLTRKLSQNFTSNYKLISVHLTWYPDCSGELLTIEEVVRRNLSLVTRAAHFVGGARHKYCAAAAELVHFSPGLVEKVQELASIDENEAASRIKKSLKDISEVDDFMCVAGVVKRSVSCHRREDGQKQLVDLNRDCWLHLRRYLKVGDILDSM
ncbi:hypothetical protein MTO96_032556 [Rhipicephalus appendiculatus]